MNVFDAFLVVLEMLVAMCLMHFGRVGDVGGNGGEEIRREEEKGEGGWERRCFRLCLESY